HQEHGVSPTGPLNLDHALRLFLERLDVVAVRAVNGNTLPAGNESDNLIAGNRRTTLGQFDPNVVNALHLDAGVSGAGTTRLPRTRQLGHILLVCVRAAYRLDKFLYDIRSRNVALANCRVQRR